MINLGGRLLPFCWHLMISLIHLCELNSSAARSTTPSLDCRSITKNNRNSISHFVCLQCFKYSRDMRKRYVKPAVFKLSENYLWITSEAAAKIKNEWLLSSVSCVFKVFIITQILILIFLPWTPADQPVVINWTYLALCFQSPVLSAWFLASGQKWCLTGPPTRLESDKNTADDFKGVKKCLA